MTLSNTIIPSTVVCLMIVASGAFAAPSQAPMTAKQRTVSYADLNIEAEAGALTLLARLQMAARYVCSPEPAIADLGSQHDYRACLKFALDNAVASIPSPELADLYRADSSRFHLARN